jgi:hypothetical protein
MKAKYSVITIINHSVDCVTLTKSEQIVLDASLDTVFVFASFFYRIFIEMNFLARR